MKTEEAKGLFKKFEGIVCECNGVECWSARELYSLLGYTQFEGEHVDNNIAVREVLVSWGVHPEQLPVGEDVKKVDCRLKPEEKRLPDRKRKRYKDCDNLMIFE